MIMSPKKAVNNLFRRFIRMLPLSYYPFTLPAVTPSMIFS